MKPRLVLALILALVAAGPAMAADDSGARRIVAVWGTGEVEASPDMAEFTSGVVTEGPTAQAALAANSATMEKVVRAVKEFGIAARDVQTRGINVSPVYTRQTRPEDQPRINGYRASNTVSVKLRDLAKLGPLLDGLTSAGANTTNGVSLSVAAPDPLRDEARQKAMADARRKADLYAGAAGARLGAVTSISEENAVMPVRMQFERAAAPMQAAVPVEAGEVQIRATVRVVYALE